MKILFFMRSTVYVRNFESTLRVLAERGHDVDVVADSHRLANSSDLIGRLCRDHSQIRHSPVPALPFNAVTFLGVELRRALDYLRYLEPEFAQAPKLRHRAERNAPAFSVALLRRPLLGSRLGRRVLGRVLRWCDRAVPRDPAVDAFMRSRRPDLVLVTPLVEPGSPQAEYLRSARALGVPTGLCVYSWDNLTNKGLIHDPLDVVTVWNEAMKAEVVALHRVPEDRVVVTGAAPYDHWFTWRTRRPREAFCSRVGLRSDRPFLLYLCSSKFIAPNETAFVRRWVGALRAASGMLRDVGVLVRPHPQNAEPWAADGLRDLDNVAVWPPAGANPVDEESRTDYYDSIHHSAAVVGVNTSALIESAIVGRPVHTLLAPEFRDVQEGTLHFHHLRQVKGGILREAADFAQHVAQLEASVGGAPPDESRLRRFIETFVRPQGVDAPSAPRVVAALEAAAARGPIARDPTSWSRFLMRPALACLAAWIADGESARKERAVRREREEYQRKAELTERRAALKAAKQQAEAERARRKQEEAARVAAERVSLEAIAAKAFETYLDVRDRVRRWRDAGGAMTSLSDSERQMVAALAHLWNASPETVATLRRWCEPITGVRAADYDCASSDLTARLKREAGFLRRQLGRELFVQEASALGGFGYSSRGERYNEDTVRFFKAMAALHDGGVLPEYRGTTRRRLVWEIGGGWGGFAHQFKTLCPNVTYVISGIPDLILVSAVYLSAVFPHARCRFYNDASPEVLWRGWEETDFIFAPESALPALRPPQLDLTLDVMALQTMAANRVSFHVQRAFDFGSRYLCSQMPAASSAGETAYVWRSIDRLYWTHPVPPRLDGAPFDSALLPDGDYAHLVGWRRIRI